MKPEVRSKSWFQGDFYHFSNGGTMCMIKQVKPGSTTTSRSQSIPGPKVKLKGKGNYAKLKTLERDLRN